MCGYHRRKLVILILALVFSLTTSRAILGQGCYTPWASRMAINGNANGQVGLAVLNNNLIVTWGDYNTNELNAAVYNGASWTYTTLSSFPLVQPGVWAGGIGLADMGTVGGVNMTTSPSNYCNAAYVAWADPGGQNIWAAKYNGTTWTLNGSNPLYTIPYETPYTLPSPTFSWQPPLPFHFYTTAPALFGANANPPSGYSTALPIGFAFPEYYNWATQPANSGSEYNTYIYGITLGQVDCNFAKPFQVGSYNMCLFWNGSTCLDWNYSAYEFDEGFKEGYYLSGPWSPLWTGAVGPNGQMVELRAMAQGNPLGNDNPPIWYSFGSPNWYNSTTPGLLGCLGADCTPGAKPYYAGQWTNNGVGGAINPVDGTAWFVYSCRYFDSDTCQNAPYFNLYHATSQGTPGTCRSKVRRSCSSKVETSGWCRASWRDERTGTLHESKRSGSTEGVA